MIDIETLVRGHAGLGAEGMRFVLTHAQLAMQANPTLPILEIGSFKGETAEALIKVALLTLDLGHNPPPFLFTVDPYGAKPYNGGDCYGIIGYGEDVYVAQKTRLAPYDNHAHFYMTGTAFLHMAPLFYWWYRGKQYDARNFSFVFLDGEHDLDGIERDLQLLIGRLVPGSRVVIDNVDKDPKVIPYLQRWTDITLGPPQSKFGARQAVLIVRGDDAF